MSMLLVAPNRDMTEWKQALLDEDPNLDIEVWPAVQHKERVQFAVSWRHPAGIFRHYPNLKAITSLGAGVDHLLNDPDLPDIPLARVVTPALSEQLADYTLMAVLNFQQRTFEYFRQKQQAVWKPVDAYPRQNLITGIMGLGQIGKQVAERFIVNGYQTAGWSASEKKVPGLTSYSGQEQFEDFLNAVNILVCLLPLTDETQGILKLEAFKKLRRPAYLINVARGAHLVEEDLIYALDTNILEGACLDVFNEEPLPDSHPFWNRENIMITPHIGAVTPPGEAAAQIVENYKRALSGMELLNTVDKNRGY